MHRPSSRRRCAGAASSSSSNTTPWWGRGMAPTAWQQFDQRAPDNRQQDHIDIAECSSVLALSLEGPP